MICGALGSGMKQAVGTCHSRAGGVNVEFNESSTATSGQDAALCGYKAAKQYTILPPFHSLFLCLSLSLHLLAFILKGVHFETNIREKS